MSKKLIEFLTANQEAQVADILEDAISLVKAKPKGSTFNRDSDGVITAVKCFYHKLWMCPQVVEFGKKASSPTGLNSMCKDGTSKWTKQQREAKKAKEGLLIGVANGDIDPAQLTEELAQIEEARNAIIPHPATENCEEGYGFETLEECLADNAARA